MYKCGKTEEEGKSGFKSVCGKAKSDGGAEDMRPG